MSATRTRVGAWVAGPGPDGMSATRAAVLWVVVTMPFPTSRKIAARVGLANTTVHRHLLALRDEGWVTWEGDHTKGAMRATSRIVLADPTVKS